MNDGFNRCLSSANCQQLHAELLPSPVPHHLQAMVVGGYTPLYSHTQPGQVQQGQVGAGALETMTGHGSRLCHLLAMGLGQ